MRKAIFTILFLLSIPLSAKADRSLDDLGVHYWISQESGVEFLNRSPEDPTYKLSKARIYALSSDSQYLHWTHQNRADEWIHNRVTPEQFLEIRKNGSGQGAGGGFYISKDPFNSASFGETPLAVSVSENVRIASVSKNFFPPDLSKQQKSEILEHLGLDGWEYNYFDSPKAWINLFNKRSIASVKIAELNDIAKIIKPRIQDLSVYDWLALDQRFNLENWPGLESFSPQVYRMIHLKPTAGDVMWLQKMSEDHESLGAFYNLAGGKEYPTVERFLQIDVLKPFSRLIQKTVSNSLDLPANCLPLKLFIPPAVI